MSRRGGPPFIHLTFASHQLSERAKTTINGPMRRRMEAYGFNDGAVRATWAWSPPDSAPEDLREQDWTLSQLHFDVLNPAIPPPIYSDTWASSYRPQMRHASWSWDSTYCPEEIYQIYRSLVEAADDEDSPQ